MTFRRIQGITRSYGFSALLHGALLGAAFLVYQPDRAPQYDSVLTERLMATTVELTPPVRPEPKVELPAPIHEEAEPIQARRRPVKKKVASTKARKKATPPSHCWNHYCNSKSSSCHNRGHRRLSLLRRLSPPATLKDSKMRSTTIHSPCRFQSPHPSSPHNSLQGNHRHTPDPQHID